MHGREQPWTDGDLYRRGAATLLASGAKTHAVPPEPSWSCPMASPRLSFRLEPERSIYNNVLLRRGLGRTARNRAIEEIGSVYSKAGVDRYAAWAHESNGPLRATLSASGYRLAETTRAMAMSLEGIESWPVEAERRELRLATLSRLSELRRLPDGLLAGVDPRAYRVLGVRIGDQDVATGLAFDHDGDCGIFNMGTLEPFRRRGLATALLTRHLLDAADRGCRPPACNPRQSPKAYTGQSASAILGASSSTSRAAPANDLRQSLGSVEISWHQSSRRELWELFALAEESPA